MRFSLARAFSHASMKTVAAGFARNDVSPKIVGGLNGQPIQPELANVAGAFVDLQQARHEADYDLSRRFTRQETVDLVEQAEEAFRDWEVVRKSDQAVTFLVGLLAQQNIRG